MSNWIAENWPMAAGFAAGLIAWGKTVTDVTSNKARIGAVEKSVGEMKDAIARIETHQEYTRTGIDEIKNELREQRSAAK